MSPTSTPAGMRPLTPEEEALLRDHDAELQEIIEAVMEEGEDLDLKLAALVDSLPDNVRMVLMRRIQEVQEHKERENQEKQRQLEEAQGKEQAAERAQKNWLQWIMHAISQDTLRKIKEALMARPTLERQLEEIGLELHKRGVLQQMEVMNRRDLGELSHNVTTRGPGAGRDQGQGRG